MKACVDMAKMSEDQQIEIIGHCVVQQRQTVAVILENDSKKIERYKNKLQEAHPGLIDIEQIAGLTIGTITLRIKPKAQNVANN